MKCKTHQGPTLERICDVQCTEVPHCNEMPLVANGEPNYLATPFQSYSFSERSWQREIRDLKSSIPKFHIPFAAALQVFNFSYREIGDLQILACTFNSRSHLHGACRIVLPPTRRTIQALPRSVLSKRDRWLWRDQFALNPHRSFNLWTLFETVTVPEVLYHAIPFAEWLGRKFIEVSHIGNSVVAPRLG